MTTPRALRPRRGQFTSLLRGLRYRLVVPVFRSPHPPAYTALGVANGVFWGLTPSVGLQTIEILATWFIARRAFRKDSSLVQALIWLWINNPVTMVPMYYVFYLTGTWMLGDGFAGGYDAFAALWERSSADGWFAGVRSMAQAVGVPLVIGSIPYAVLGSALSYHWTLKVLRRRKAKLFGAM